MTEALENGAAEVPHTRTSEEVQALGGYLIAGNLTYMALTPSEKELGIRAQMPAEVADLMPYDMVERFIANYGQPLPEGRQLPPSQRDKLAKAEFDFVFGLGSVLRQRLTTDETVALSQVTMRVPQNGVRACLNGHLNTRNRLGKTYMQRLNDDAAQRLPKGLDFVRYTLRQVQLPLEAQMVRVMNCQTQDRHSEKLALGRGYADILTAFGLWLSGADQAKLFH